MVYGLAYRRFEELVQLAVKAREEEEKEQYTLAAFIGWQMGAGGKVKFGEYLRKLGLGDKPTKDSKADKASLDGRLKSMGIVPQKENRK